MEKLQVLDSDNEAAITDWEADGAGQWDGAELQSGFEDTEIDDGRDEDDDSDDDDDDDYDDQDDQEQEQLRADAQADDEMDGMDEKMDAKVEGSQDESMIATVEMAEDNDAKLDSIATMPGVFANVCFCRLFLMTSVLLFLLQLLYRGCR